MGENQSLKGHQQYTRVHENLPDRTLHQDRGLWPGHDCTCCLAQVTVIQNNTTLYNLYGGTRYYQIDVPPGKSTLSVQT